MAPTTMYILVRIKSLENVVIATNEDLLHHSMTMGLKEVSETLGEWRSGGTEIKMRWPKQSLQHLDHSAIAEKDFRIFTITVLDFSVNKEDLTRKITAKKSSPPVSNSRGSSVPPSVSSLGASSSSTTVKSRADHNKEATGSKQPAKKARLQRDAQTDSQIADVLQAESDEDDDFGDGYDSDDDLGRKKSQSSRPSSTATNHPLSPSMFPSDNEEDDVASDVVELQPMGSGEFETSPESVNVEEKDEEKDASLEESEISDLRELLLQKDKEIAALKRELQAANKRMENNPGIIIEDLKASLAMAKSLISATHGSFPPTPGSSRSSSPGSTSSNQNDDRIKPAKMVPLYKGCHLKLSSTHLKLACSYGIADKLDKGKRACVFKIMESIYSEEFMASHSLTGRPAPGAPKEEAKPALPQEDVDAIIQFIKAQWKEWHKLDCEDKTVRSAIYGKLGLIHRKAETERKRLEKLEESRRTSGQ